MPPVTPPASSRFSFLAKLGAAAVLVAVGDAMLYGFEGGSIIGAFGFLWLAVMALARPAVRRARGGWFAISCAALFAAICVIEPWPLPMMLFLAAIGSAALLVRHVFDNALLWTLRLGILGLRAPLGTAGDLWRLASLPGGSGASAATLVLMNLVLPLAGGALFLALFASANPVLDQALGAFRLPDITTLILHAMLMVVILGFTWPTLRPRALRLSGAEWALARRLPDPPVTMALITLGVFNAVFALENILDIAFLWSGAPLPEGVTLAEYAHQGAYTLIATALLAGLFVLVALRPGGVLARQGGVRRLVIAWVAQNVLLVASSMLRLADYIAAYSLTEWRIAALGWMVLVASGLMLVCWRFLTGRSAAWLINVNAVAAGIALIFFAAIDLGAVAARWNVDHLDDPAKLDMCYLDRLDGAALLPLIELSRASVAPALQDRALYLAHEARASLEQRQADWQAWTLRGAWRLARAERLLEGDTRAPAPAPFSRSCGGEILPRPFTTSPALTPQENP